MSTAAVLHRPGPPPAGSLVVGPRDTPTPGPGEVLVAVEACGLCRTDLQLCDGDLGAHRLPVVPGHQVVGTVVAHGVGVDTPAIGARVGIAWIASACGTCRYCATGRENLCPAATFTGWDRDGGLADHVTARAEFTTPIPGGLDPAAVAPLLCGGAIGLRSLRLSGVHAGDRLGLYGFGASATVAIQIARHFDIEVFVVTRSSAEQDRARRLGAGWAGDYGTPVPVVLDAAITFAPVGSVVVEALGGVGPGGSVTINAIHLDEIPRFDYQLLWQERQLRSVANVTRADVAEVLALVEPAAVVTEYETHRLAGVNEALARMRSGAVRGAAVVVTDRVSRDQRT